MPDAGAAAARCPDKSCGSISAGHAFPPRTPVRRKAAWEAERAGALDPRAGLEKPPRARPGATWRFSARGNFGSRRCATRFTRDGLEVEVQSETEIKGDSPGLRLADRAAHDHGRAGRELRNRRRPARGLRLVRSRSGGVRGGRRRGASICCGSTTAMIRFRAEAALAAPDAERDLSAAAFHRRAGSDQDRPTARAAARVCRAAISTIWMTSSTRLLASAARRRGGRHEPHDFARYLRDDFMHRRAKRPPRGREAAIQLITSHKAKGSEWQAVIVPFLMREVDSRADNFPRLTNDRVSRRQRILFHKEEVTREMEDGDEDDRAAGNGTPALRRSHPRQTHARARQCAPAFTRPARIRSRANRRSNGCAARKAAAIRRRSLP